MSNGPLRRVSDEEQVIDLLADTVLEIMVDPDNIVRNEAALIEAMRRYSYVPHPHFDHEIVMSVLAGVNAYLDENRDLIGAECDRMRGALTELRVADEKEEQLQALHQFLLGAYLVLRYFHGKFPRPPFLAIEGVLPIESDEMGIVHARTGEVWGHLDDEFRSLTRDLKRVKRHLVRIEKLVQPGRRQYFKRFYYWLIVNRCRRVKQARFRRALNRLTITTDSFHSFLRSYLSHYQHNVKFRQEFDEPF